MGIAKACKISCTAVGFGTNRIEGLNGVNDDELRTHLPDCYRAIAQRAALSRVRRSRANLGTLPVRTLAFARWTARGRGMVLERLSRHGTALRRDRRHDRSGREIRHRRRRHTQHFRHAPSRDPARARASVASRKRKRAPVHLGLRREPDRACDRRASAS